MEGRRHDLNDISTIFQFDSREPGATVLSPHEKGHGSMPEPYSANTIPGSQIHRPEQPRGDVQFGIFDEAMRRAKDETEVIYTAGNFPFEQQTGWAPYRA
jgi:hypothetical protein